MKYYWVVTFFTILFFSCSQPQRIVRSISCASHLQIQYDNSISKGVMAKSDKRMITIFFLNYFHDSINVFINGNLKFHDLVIIDTTTGKSGKIFSYDYSYDNTTPVMKVATKNGNCFDIQINPTYKIVYLFYDGLHKWTARYSNRYYVDN